MSYNSIQLHIGYRNCGKSEFVEKELEEKYEKRLYIGTLFHDNEKYNESIMRHQQRRDNLWQLYEITNQIDNDMDNIKHVIEKKKIESCIIDGITTWCLLLHRRGYDINYIISRLSGGIISLLSMYNIVFRIIDVVPDVFADISDISMCSELQKQIIDKANLNNININIIDWRYGKL